MSSIQSAIQIVDRITSPVNNMISALNNLCGAYEAVDNEMQGSFDRSRIDSARAAINQAVQEVSACRQEIQRTEESQERFNDAIDRGASSASKLSGFIGKAAGALGAFFGINKIINFCTDSTKLFNTQLNAETQLMTVLANMVEDDYILEVMAESNTDSAIADINSIQDNITETVVITPEMKAAAIEKQFESITEKAAAIQSKGIYGDEAMIAGAAELSTYFTDSDAIEMMMDTLSNYAMGMSGGGALDSSQMTDYATGLGKIMSGAYDAMTKKGFEFTDAQKAVIEGTATEAEYIAVLGEQYTSMSDDMRAATAITQVVNEAWGGLYETMSNTPEGKIIQMNNTWGDMKETVAKRLYPAIVSIADAVTENWDTISAVMDGATEALTAMIEVLGAVAEGVLTVAQFFVDNWGWIEPILAGICTGLAIYYGWVLLVKVATTLAAAAQGLWNMMMNLNPAGAVAITVGALVAALGLYTNGVNEAYGLSLSFAGMLGGTLMTILAALGNIVIMIYNLVVEIVLEVWNLIGDFVNFFANVWTDPLGSVVRLFVGIFDTILAIIETVADAIGSLFGQDWSSGIQGFRDKMNAAVTEQFGEGVVNVKVDEKLVSLDYIDYGEAFDAGYYLGENGFGDATSGGSNTDLSDIYDILNKAVGSDVSDIADNTAQTADALDITDEDLKYLRDIAEREAINRFTTAEVSVNFGGITQNVNSDSDLDGIIDYFASGLQEALETTAEGVHA